MNVKRFLIPALMATSSLAVAAESTDDRITKLEKQIDILKSQNETSQASAIRFNGFFSVGATAASNNLGYVNSSNRLGFEELTRLGLQASFDIDDSTSVTTQMLAKSKGSDNFEANVEWAYVSHTFDNDGTVRAGKLRLPLFMYSDFLDVGIAQPWVRPPEEVYGAPLSSYLGMDYSKNFDLDDSTIGFQIYGGQSEFEVSTPSGTQTAKLPIFAGVVTTWSNDTLTLRGTYLRVQSFNNSDDDGAFYGIGAGYDDDQLLLIGELTGIDSDDVDQNNQMSAYVTLGYRVDAWLPYVTVSKIKSKGDEKRTIDSNKQRLEAYSLGTKYNLASNMSIKADVTYVTNFGDTTGVINKNTDKKLDDSAIYSVRFDTVF